MSPQPRNDQFPSWLIKAFLRRVTRDFNSPGESRYAVGHPENVRRKASGFGQNFGFRFVGRSLRCPPCHGGVAEWSIVPDSKSGVPQGTVGSNPTPSAMLRREN